MMRRDEPATMMHLIRPLLLLLGVLSLLLVAEHATGDRVRIIDVSGSTGPDIVLSQVAELEGEYAKQYAGLVVATFVKDQTQHEVEAAAIVTALRDKGAKLGLLDFSGFGKCKVYRTAGTQERAKPSDSEEPVANPDSKGGNEPITLHTATTVRSLIEQAVVKGTGVGKASLVITFDDKDGELLRSSAVAGRFEVESEATPALGKTLFKVYAYHGTKRVGNARTVMVRVQQKVIAVIAGSTIKRETKIGRRQVRLTEVLIDDAAQAYLADTQLVVGLVAKSTVKAGEMITPDDIKMPIAVSRRQQVTVELKSNGITITFNAIAQQAGAVGEVIEVLRPGSRDRISAKIVARGKVVAGDAVQEPTPKSSKNNKTQPDQPNKEGNR